MLRLADNRYRPHILHVSPMFPASFPENAFRNFRFYFSGSGDLGKGRGRGLGPGLHICMPLVARHRHAFCVIQFAINGQSIDSGVGGVCHTTDGLCRLGMEPPNFTRAAPCLGPRLPICGRGLCARFVSNSRVVS